MKDALFGYDGIMTTRGSIYKKLKLIGLVLACILLLVLIIVIIVMVSKPSTITIIPSEESSLKVVNPDQGFYHPVLVKLKEDSVTKGYNPSEQLYHLKVDISLFSKAVNNEADKEFTAVALQGLEDVIQNLRKENKNAVIRFAYDPYFEGKANLECNINMIKRHIEQVSPILNKYKDVITGVEVGLLGVYGEMHGSTMATEENKQIVIKHLIENIKDIPILTRNPNSVYIFSGYKNFNEIENITLTQSNPGYRLGLFNDGMYGSYNDLGTFLVNTEREIKWFSRQNDHLPYGGEAVYSLETDRRHVAGCIPEMFKDHLSYLNYEWNQNLHNNIWKKELFTADILQGHKAFEGLDGYTFVTAHLGYRLVIEKIEAKASGSDLTIKINVLNKGFGYVNKEKEVGVVFAYINETLSGSANGFIKEEKKLGKFFGKQSEINIETSLVKEPKGIYAVYLRLYHEIDSNGVVKYPIKFANQNIYNDKLSGNFLFKLDIENEIIKE